MKLLLILIATGLFSGAFRATAQFNTAFMIGVDDGSQAEFEQESGSLVDYYWANGDYTTVGGQIWTSGSESWNDSIESDPAGFPRALVHPGPTNTHVNIFFNLERDAARPHQPIRLTLDFIGLKANTTHDIEVNLNGVAPFAVRKGIGSDQTWIIETTAGEAGAAEGPNVLQIRRTGGTIVEGGAWIQFDYIKLETDVSDQFIGSFTTNDLLVRPGETATLSWTLLEPAATVSISPSGGSVPPLTFPDGGSVQVSPSTDTTYTLTATFNGLSQTRSVAIKTSGWEAVFEAGADDHSCSEFSHESAADDDYYFAGDYNSVGGPLQAANEILNDDTDTDTAAGRTGNRAVGFERAVTEFDPVTNIWFIPKPAQVNLTARHRVSVNVLYVTSPGGEREAHTLEISLNGRVLRTENAISGARLIEFEVSGITSGLKHGPNSLSLRRLGGTPGGSIVFDNIMMEYLPGTAPAISGVTDDAILGTHTIAWTAQAAKTYRVQKSTDSGTSWMDMAAGFPTGGSASTSLFYEDRLTPFADPRPAYRVLQE